MSSCQFNMTNFIENTFNAVYRWVFKENPTSGSKKFFKNLGIIGVSFAIAKILTGLTNIAAGRLLGPNEYGKLNLIISIGAILSTCLLIGINYSIIKYGVLKEKQKKTISTAFLFSAPYMLIISALAYFCKAKISVFFGISQELLIFAIFYAAAISLFHITSSILQTLSKFKQRGLGEISFAIIFLLSFAGGALMIGKTFEAMAYAYIIAFSAVSLFFVLKLKLYLL